MLVGPRLGYERRPTRPFAAHAETKKDAEDSELPDGLRKATREGKD